MYVKTQDSRLKRITIATLLAVSALSGVAFAETDAEKITRLEAEKAQVTKALEEYKQISDKYGTELKKSHAEHMDYVKEVDNYIITKLNESITRHDAKTQENIDRLSALDENIKRADEMQKDVGTIGLKIESVESEKQKMHDRFVKQQTETNKNLIDQLNKAEKEKQDAIDNLKGINQSELSKIKAEHEATTEKLLQGFKKNDEAVRLSFEIESIKLQQTIDEMKKAENQKIKVLTDKNTKLQNEIKKLTGK